MSDFEELKDAQETLELIKSNGNWFILGLVCTVALIVLGVWILLLITWPITFTIITAVILSPILIGLGVLKFSSNRVKQIEKKLNTKEDAVQI